MFNHKNDCPCKGNPQKVSKRLAARIKETPNNDGKSKLYFHKPGSQNRKK